MVEWRQGETHRERRCPQCREWRTFVHDHWYINRYGYAHQNRCRFCINPTGRKRGMPKGTKIVARHKTHRQRMVGMVATNDRTARISDIVLNPNAAVDAALRLGLDPKKIARWFDADIRETHNFGGPVRPQKTA